MNLRTAAATGLALTLAGCAARGPRPPEIQPDRAGARTVAAALSARPCPERLAGDCEIRATPAGGRTVRLYGSFRAAWPERIRVQARIGPFLPVASIAVDPDSATLSLPRLKSYWSGPVSGGSGPTGIAGGLLWLLCPSPLVASMKEPALDRVGKEWTLRGDGVVGGRGARISVRLDRSAREIREVQITDRNGRPLVHAVRRGRMSAGGVDLPRRIRLDLFDPPGSYEIEITRARTDPDQPPDLYRIPRPAGARRIGDADLFEVFGGAASD
jgi:hypothetical protein